MHAPLMGQYDVYGDPSQGAPATTDYGQVAVDLAKTWVQYEQARDISEINLTRAQQGLAPLDPSKYGMGVQVGVSPEIRNLLIGAGILVAVLWVVPALLKRRR